MHAVGQATLEDVIEPRAADGCLVVKPTVAGICATDLHVLYHGALIDDQCLPLTLGHEFVGEVVELPAQPYHSAYPALGSMRVGSRVAVEPLLPCMRCYQCFRGRQNLCLHMRHLGISADGCFADYVAVPALRAVPVPDSVSDRAAALVELVACAVNFVDSARFQAGDVCVVVGAGPAGLASVQAAAASGASAVVAIEPVAERRTLALECGASHACVPGDEARAVLGELTGGVGADVVLECVGTAGAVNGALEATRGGGRVMLAGIPTERPEIDTELVVTRELTVVGAFASAWSFERAIRWIERGLVHPEQMVTGELPLNAIASGIERALRDQTQGKLHVNVQVNDKHDRSR